MADQAYEKLLDDDVDSVELAASRRDTADRRPLLLTACNLVLFCCSALLFILSMRSVNVSPDTRSSTTVTHADDLGYQRLYCKCAVMANTCSNHHAEPPSAPLWDAVEYQTNIFYANVEENEKFTGPPRPELDEAWANVTEGEDTTMGMSMRISNPSSPNRTSDTAQRDWRRAAGPVIGRSRQSRRRILCIARVLSSDALP